AVQPEVQLVTVSYDDVDEVQTITTSQDLLAPVEVTVSLTVETSQSEIQELRLSAEHRREVQSIIVKAFAESGSASTPASEVAEKQLVTVEGDGTGGGTFSLEFEGGVVSSLPFSAGAAVVQASIEANLTAPTGSLGSSSVTLEEATSTRRSYLVTFPSDLGDAAMVVGYGDVGSVVSAVIITEETRGSVQEIQRVYQSGQASGGTFTLSLLGESTPDIVHNATSDEVRVALEAISVMGDVSISKGNLSSAPEWTVTFLNNAGDLPLLAADSSAMWGGVTVAVDEERNGTSEGISGSFALSVAGNDTENVVVAHDASATELKNALESLSTTPDALDVTRFEFLNGGSLWTVTFPAASGDVPSLAVNASGLSGSGLLAAVSEDTAGSSLGGSFYLYSNGGSSAGYPVDAEGAYLGVVDRENNGTGRSQRLGWNADADDVRVAVEELLPLYAAAGDISVSRSNSSNTTSLWDGNDGRGGGYTWTITFPLSARDAPELGFDGAALEGKGAAGNIVETRMSRAPEIQRLSTLAGSEVYGGFSLMFAETETDQLPFNATADEVESALRALPGLANVTVTRSEPKGLSYYPADHAATLWYASSQLSRSIDVQTFDWDIIFEGLAGPQPLLQQACCGEREFGDASSIIDAPAATMKSKYTGDASVGVFRLSPGTGERLGGTWYLSLDGEASTRIDAGASAEEVSAAVTNLTSAGNVTVTEITEIAGYNGERSWVVTFLDWNDPNHTATPPIVTVGDEGLTGTGAAATLEAAAAGGSYTTAGSDGELEMPHLCAKAVVQLSSLLSSGYIDECVVVAAWQGSTSYAVPPFSFDANATSVETALEGVDPTALGPVWVSSEGGASASGGGVWNVTFVGNSEGRTPELQCASDADVQQVSESSCEAIGGSFSLGFGGNTTQEIAFNASALEVQAALEGLPAVDNVTVTAADNGPNGGREWRVVFSGSELEGNLPLMIVDTDGLTGIGVHAEVAEITPGNEPTGRFMLQADTAPRGWPEHRSGWISVGSTAAEVGLAVAQIPWVRVADVSVNASLPTVGPVAWEITFPHRQLEEMPTTDDDELLGSGYYVATGQSGDRPPLRVVRAQLAGSGATADAETVNDGERVIGGSYEVYLEGGTDNATTTVRAGASAADLRFALVDELGLPETTDIVRVGPLDDSLAYTWTVTLPEGTSLWGNNASVVGQLAVNASQLTGQAETFVEALLVRAGAAPLGGEFNVSLAEDGGEEEGKWVSLPHNATDDDVAAAISSFSASGGNVTVSSDSNIQENSGNEGSATVTGKRWMVTFSALAAAGDVPAIGVNWSSSSLTGAGVGVYVNETSKGVTADVQGLTIDGYSGTFAFVFADATNASISNSTSSPVRWNASSSDLAEALLEATGKRVYVERTPVTAPTSSATSGGFTWLVLFAEALSETWDKIRLNTTSLVPDDAVLAGSSRQANLSSVRNSTADGVGGGFSLRFGQSCDERAAGVYCSMASTHLLGFDSSPGDVRAALEDLPAVVDATVTTTTGSDDDGSSILWKAGIGTTAPDGFGVSSSLARFRVTLSAVAFNASDSELAEYWRRTWAPEHSATEWSGDFATGGDLPLVGVDVTGLFDSHAAGHAEEITKGLSTEVGGVVALEVSQNAGRDYTASGVTYVYEALVSVSALLPDHGPIFGGTEVLVRGENFRQSSRLACQFGPSGVDPRVTVPATFLNTSALLCISPARLTPPAHPVGAAAAVEVTNNAAVGGGAAPWSTFSRSGVYFRYEAAPEIGSVVPHLGPASGNFSVRVAGGPFPDTTELRCRFGGVVVLATRLSPSEVQCYAPPMEAGTYPLELSLNNQDYTGRRFPFLYFDDQASRITPVSGPAAAAGTAVTFYGRGFVNTTKLACRFGLAPPVPANFVNPNELFCESPPLVSAVNQDSDGGGIGLRWSSLSEIWQREYEPLTGSRQLFPDAHYHPLFPQRAVGVEVTCNGQDYTDSGTTFLYQADASVHNISLAAGLDPGESALFITGENFVNSTSLSCRIGGSNTPATFLSASTVLCFVPRAASASIRGSSAEAAAAMFEAADARNVEDERGYNRGFGPREGDDGSSPDSWLGPLDGDGDSFYVEVSNNGLDYTADRVIYTVEQSCPGGSFCVGPSAASVLPCPQGAFCPGDSNKNFTLCPLGTYQPSRGRSACLRCPVGFHCPDEGMPVPRVCPAGRVCDVTGVARADQPCPEGHFCLEGTATTATTCGHPSPSSRLFPTASHAERTSTLRSGYEPLGSELVLGSRAVACWNNATEDFGLQMSDTPARFWMEAHTMPLSYDSPFAPLRGRYCLDNTCAKLDDANDYRVVDSSGFDYASFRLRRPVPCPAGTYCHPGSASEDLGMHNFTMPQPCLESMFCPEGSSRPSGVGECPSGFYCPTGIRLSCPVGTYCPREGHWDPMPCPPGQFSAMVGQKACTSCPRGYICPGFGRIDPTPCPDGMVCSRNMLTSPNQRCPPGFYCPQGTVTSDPFRNDTTLRPYPCSPGSYCLGGVGFSEVRSGDYLYAQTCPAGFFCETASTGPTGSGLCPRGFFCPVGTAVPIPSPKGFFSDLEGMVSASACLPGFYSPTIESQECYPCPPGTTCAEDGTSVADICSPGTYRSTLDEDGTPCAACPQGTWSKNWELREAGECQWCPTGVVCSVEGMVNPCSQEDLPTPFEPVVTVNDIPMLEYLYSEFARPPYFSGYECLHLNDGYADGTLDPVDQEYFFGELIPPYIDKLGRGAHLRPTDSDNTLYQSEAKCYRNVQALGSKVYQHMQHYYGPQYDIQTGVHHQGYGDEDSYDGFWGKGSLYIDLPRSRMYDASFNCTPGFQLMNNDSVSATYDDETLVYTDPDHDPEGQRLINLVSDTWYPGTCEADIICDVSGSSEAEACPEGYVCEESSNSEESVHHPCREGYVCDFGTTPDPDLEAPEGQFTQLCPVGFVCTDATGLGQAYRQVCYENYFCPTGTGDPRTGQMADDAVNRGLTAEQVNPFLNVDTLKYLGDEDVRMVSAHDLRCLAGTDTGHKERYFTRWLGEYAYPPNSLTVDYLRVARPGKPPYTNDTSLALSSAVRDRAVAGGLDAAGTYLDVEGYVRPSVINEAIAMDLSCARDHKWRLVSMAIERQECNCVNQIYVIAGVYRLWRCTGGELDDLGVASIHEEYNGGRDFWFERTHLSSKVCEFQGASTDGDGSNAGLGLNLTFGAIPQDPDASSISELSAGALYLNTSEGLRVQFTWTESRDFLSYESLKRVVESEYESEYEQRVAGSRDAIDPYVYDLYQAVRYVEEFGERLEDLVWIDAEGLPGRLDMCECERLLHCPNGTISAAGSENIYNCEADGSVLRRLNAIPDRYMFSPNFSDHVNNGSAFSELTGRDDFTLGTLRLDSLEVAVVTLDLSALSRNVTYGQHYQLAVYLDCKPCPTRYQCLWEVEPPTCSTPSLDLQMEAYEDCLQKYFVTTCFDNNGTTVGCGSEESIDSFEMPDWYRCRQIPAFCDDTEWPVLEWQILFDQYGNPLSGNAQEDSWFYTPEDREGEIYETTPGCCQCESHSLPPYFDDTSADQGYPDTKHNLISFSLTALKEVEVTAALELLHGMYYSDFDNMMDNIGELFIFTPARSDYKPLEPSRKSFFFLLAKDDFTDLQLPFNLPKEHVRVAASLPSVTEAVFENKVFIDRAYDIDVADPTYFTKYARYLNQEAFLANDNATIPDYDTIPEREAVRPEYDDVFEDSNWWASGDDSGANTFLTMPYFPFLSSCAGYGNHMSFSKLVESHPGCTLIPYEQTKAINQWRSIGKSPFSDECLVQLTSEERYDDDGNLLIAEETRGVYLDCTFEEDISMASAQTRWFQADAGTTLFHVTKDPLDPMDFEETVDSNGDIVTGWGRSITLESLLGTYRYVPVEVSEDYPGEKHTKPQNVKLTINYFQRQRGTKRMVDMFFEFTELCTTIPPLEYGGNEVLLETFAAKSIEPCEVDINGDLKDYGYTLEVQYVALTWMDLVNFFEFDWMLYMVLFMAVGIIAVTEAIIVWGINRLLTKLRHPPKFHGSVLFHIVSEAPTQGVMLAFVPALLTVAFIWCWFAENSFIASSDPVTTPSAFNFEGVTGSWQDNLALTTDRILTYRTGRIGVCLIASMIYIALISVELFVPDWTEENKAEAEANVAKDIYYNDDDEDQLPTSPVFAPMQWKRAHLLWASLVMQGLLVGIWEFSYSNTFATYVYQFIVGFKIAQMFMDLVLEGLLRELLMVAPLLVIVGITEQLVTMGAEDFKDFVVSFFVELSVMMLERLYLDPGTKEMSKLYPRWRMMWKRRFSRRRRMTREDKAKEEMAWRKINEDIELEREGVEPLLDSYFVYSTEVLGMFIMPGVIFLIMVFSQQTKMAELYGIRDNEMGYYLAFALVIIPFSLIMDVFVLNTQELVHGWRVYDYIAYQKYRFSVRQHRWMMRNETLDESIAEPMQTLDLLCFSSQFYFINSLFAVGMIFGLMGLTIFLRWEYSLFGDPIGPLIFAVMFLFGDLVQQLLRRLANIKVKRMGWRGLWMTKNIEGTVDDDIAAKLAIGEGRQANLEQERLELQALNSERFRHRFLERNRPWILQHLTDLLTPRTLQNTGPDGRPAVEYVRDVYAELMGMGEGVRRPGDRSDISSDEEDEMEEQRRNWPRTPLVGASLAIARLWLAKARKRRSFWKFVAGIVQNNQAEHCAICECAAGQQGRTLAVSLALEGKADAYAIDRLIAGFEELYGVDEMDANLWKAYFRANAEYITRCSKCTDRLEQERLKRLARAPGADRATRMDDISSDEDDDEAVFDAVVVTRTSPEGRMMSKWLNAARTKLGGVHLFPKPEAKAQMERYVERMRKRKLQGGKQDIAGKKEEDPRTKDWIVELSAASKALAVRWLRAAREGLDGKFRARGEKLREDVHSTAALMPPEDDWFFGAELRLEGQALMDVGQSIEDDRRALEAEGAVKIRKIEVDFEHFEKTTRADMEKDRKAFEHKINVESDAVNTEVELRTRELLRLRDVKQQEQNVVETRLKEDEGGVPSAVAEAHRKQLEDMDDVVRKEQQAREKKWSEEEASMRSQFEQREALTEQTVVDRKVLAGNNIIRINKETRQKIKGTETEWQGRASKWLATARRKVELKQTEDAEDAERAKRRR
ncbi:unnamed protein product, partial [Ectocarpus fasciculatus]